MKKFFLFFTLCVISTLFAAGNLFAAIPIQGATLRGEAAYNARFRLLAAAEAYLGTPYRYAGMNRAGMDCSGLIFMSFRDALNIQSPRTTETLYAWAEKINTADLRVGDLVFFITDGKAVSHVGIYAGSRRFIHSASEGPHTGVMYSTLDEAYWSRTYTGAGRALPWDAEAEAALLAGQIPDAPMAGGGNGADAANPDRAYTDGGAERPRSAPRPQLSWASDKGVFAGFGISWTFGGFIEGAPSIFRGIAGQAKIGYKWDTFRVALELRPQWDRGLGVFHLPFDICLGTDRLQFFVGPAFTVGAPENDDGRTYYQSFALLGEAGVTGALPPINMESGSLSFFGELAWQPFTVEEGQGPNRKADLTANMRVSAGVRYLWLIK